MPVVITGIVQHMHVVRSSAVESPCIAPPADGDAPQGATCDVAAAAQTLCPALGGGPVPLLPLHASRAPHSSPIRPPCGPQARFPPQRPSTPRPIHPLRPPQDPLRRHWLHLTPKRLLPLNLKMPFPCSTWVNQILWAHQKKVPKWTMEAQQMNLPKLSTQA